MNTYFIFVGGAIALIGGVFLIQTLGKSTDETVWIMRGHAVPVEAQDLKIWKNRFADRLLDTIALFDTSMKV
jgi:hypothetical protein